MGLPLVALELTRGGKRRWNYVLRMGPVIFMYVFGVYGVIVGGPLTMGLHETGLFFRDIPRFFQFLVVFGLAPVFAAGGIAEERRDRTFDLLVLADLRGGDLYFAKLMSAFGQVMLLLLSTLPLLAFASLFGGVYVPAEALRVALLAACGLAVCTIGLFFSTVCRRPIEALLLTVAAESLVLAGWPLLGSGTALPGYNLLERLWAIDQDAMGPSMWVGPGVSAAGIAIVCAGLTLFLLPRLIAERPTKFRRRRKRVLFPNGLIPMSQATRLVTANVAGRSVFSDAAWMRFVIAVALMPVGFGAVFLGAGVVVLAGLIGYWIASAVAASRQDGALDTILVTPMHSSTMARALITAFWRQSLVFYPACLTPFAFVALMIADPRNFGSWITPTEEKIIAAPFVVMAPAVLLWALCACGCFVSTLKLSPAAQAATAAGIFLGIHAGLTVALYMFLERLMRSTGQAFLFPALASTYGFVMVWVGFGFRAALKSRIVEHWRSDLFIPEIYHKGHPTEGW